MVKILARKLRLCELLRFHYKYKNKTKRLWPKEMFIERQLKGEFHVLSKELKVFDHEFLFKHIATEHFDFSQRCLTVFVLSFNRLYSVILLVDNTPIKYLFSLWSFLLGVGIFSNCKTGKRNSSTRKRNYCFLSKCA